MGQRVDAEWVGNGEPVEAYCHGDPDHVHGTGVAIAYYDAPTFIIRRPDGSTFTWSAALVRPASGGQS